MRITLSHWRALRWLAVSRIVIALVLFALFPLHDTRTLSGGVSDLTLYGATAQAYLILAVLFLSVQGWLRRFFDALVFAQSLTDIVALALMMHAAGGLQSGLVVLLVVALAGSAIVTTRRMAAFFAALATLSVLVVAGVPMLVGSAHGAESLLLAGWAGIGFFATALTVNWLATRLHAQERIAQLRADDLRRQLAVTSRVVAELAQGVLIVDADGVVRTMNGAAQTFFAGLAPPFVLVPEPSPESNGDSGAPVRDPERDSERDPERDRPHEARTGSAARSGPAAANGAAAWSMLAEAYRQWRCTGAEPEAVRILKLPAVDGLATNMQVRFLGSARTGEDTVIMLEDQRLVEERAQQLKLASMGRFSASIAHEIRNPLSAIRHANGLLAEGLAMRAGAALDPWLDPGDPAPEQALAPAAGDPLARLVRIIETNTVRIDRIVEDVLSVARRQRPDAERIDAAAFIGHLLDEFATTAGVGRGRVELRLDSVHPIRFDAGHLRQVLLNLLTNAVRHATQEDGAVRVEWRDREDGRTELRVADDGPGLDAGMLAHVFEPFYTADARGTGLGLYLARELCSANRATIRYEMAPAAQRWRSAFILEPQNE